MACLDAKLIAVLQALRRVLVVLIAFAIVGGTTFQLAHSAAYSAAGVGTPCDLMMSTQTGDGHVMPLPPCKTMTADCLKQLGCVADIALPARFASLQVLAHPTSVDYWSTWSNLAGLVRVPELLPPRTA